MTPLPVRPKRTEAMATRDGTRLVADIWQPEGPGPWPVLMMRQAYGRRIGTSLCYAPPEWYAARGYIVVMQDVRGRGESGGGFALFEHEAADGADSVAWAAALPGSNGRVGMFGFSFQGSNQLLAAGEPCPALKAIAPAMIGWDIRRDWAYENGAFALRANIGWATQLAAETARLAGDREAQARLYAASRTASFADAMPAWPEHDALLQRYSHYAVWRDTPLDDPYWDAISPAARQARIVANGPATLLIGGWYDSHLPGTLAAFRALAPHLPARLIVGPWAHFPWDRRVGALDFGEDAITDIDQQQIAWFDRWLKDDAPGDGSGDGPGDGPAVRLFDMGARCWRDFAAWPEGDAAPGATPEQARLGLDGSGRAAIDMRHGRLLEGGAGAPGWESLTLDPWRPAAPCGGSFGWPPGPVDRAGADARADTLTFTGAPATERMLIAGDVRLSARIESAHASFDLHAVLSRVAADGRSFPLAEGYATLEPGAVSVPMRATCCTLQPGERLRLSLALACFPSFPVNPGTGRPPWEAGIFDHQVVTVRLRRDKSILHVPLRAAEEQA